MKVRIRDLSHTHYERCIEMQKMDGFPHAYYLTPERMNKLSSNGEQFIGAFNEKNLLIGFTSINIDMVRMRIHFFIVDQQFQKKGVGSKLLSHIQRIAHQSNVTNIYSYSEIDSPLEHFLIHKGFEKAGYFKRRFGDRDADILSMYF